MPERKSYGDPWDSIIRKKFGSRKTLPSDEPWNTFFPYLLDTATTLQMAVQLWRFANWSTEQEKQEPLSRAKILSLITTSDEARAVHLQVIEAGPKLGLNFLPLAEETLVRIAVLDWVELHGNTT